MCGRFVQFNNFESVIKIDHVATNDLKPSYNIVPSQQVSVIINQNGKIILDKYHWGLLPFWAKDKSIGNRMINARMETIAEKPAFRAAFKKRRCLIPADGFYEWKGKAGNKQPYYITIPSGQPFVFAGIWELWDKEDPPYRSCAIITTAASKSVQAVHHRMPVILQPEYHEKWLDPDSIDPLSILKDGMIKDMKYHPVPKRVNKAANNDPSCKDPIDL